MVEQVSYAVSVGQGGAIGAVNANGNNGANSSLVVSSGTITAIGGGGGGGANVAGLSGGSGGGGSWTGAAVYAGGTGTALQGNNGGDSVLNPSYPYYSFTLVEEAVVLLRGQIFLQILYRLVVRVLVETAGIEVVGIFPLLLEQTAEVEVVEDEGMLFLLREKREVRV